MEENCLTIHLCEQNLFLKIEKKLHLLRSKHQTQRLLPYYIGINIVNVYQSAITVSIQIVFI